MPVSSIRCQVSSSAGRLRSVKSHREAALCQVPSARCQVSGITIYNILPIGYLRFTSYNPTSVGSLPLSIHRSLFTLRHLLFAISCLLFAIGVSPALAQTPEANVKFFVKSPAPDQPITVGDPITLRLEVEHPSNSRVILPQLDKQWQDFEVLKQTQAEVVDNGDGTATTGKDIVVTLFAPGQYQTPLLTVTHQQADGRIEELAAPVIPLQVTSVLTDDQELRDIKPQADLPVPPLWPWILLGVWLALLLAAGLTILGWWLYHRPRRQPATVEAVAPVLDTRPPEVIAYEELARIEAMNLPAQQRIKEHYSLVSDCLRCYIEGRYQVPALEQTTGELQSAFKKIKAARREANVFLNLFMISDLVKFARYLPPPDEVGELIPKARMLVDATTPTAEPAPKIEVMA